jgi:hypothetical protein
MSVDRKKNQLVYSSAVAQKRADLNNNMLIKDSPEPSFINKEQ